MNNFPNSWESTALENVIDYVIGGDWGKELDFDDPEYTQVLCIRGAEFRNWEKEKGKTASLRKIKKTSLQNRCLLDGDILIEISGGGPEQPVGRSILIDNAALSFKKSIFKVCTNFIRLIRPNKNINSKFLNNYLHYFYNSSYISDFQSGSNNLRNLKFDEYIKISIPLPPLEEQKRIVAKIEELFSEIDKGIENLLKAQEILNAYRQSLFKYAFEGKLTANWRRKNAIFSKDCKQNILKSEQNLFLPELWTNSRLGDLVSQISKKKMPHEFPEYPFLGMDCLAKNALKPHFTYQFKDLKSAGNWFNKNHILYGRLRPYLNKVYRAEYEGVASGEFIVLQSISMINPDWLKYVLHAQSFVNWSNKQTTGDKPRVRYDQIALYSLNVPPREEQDKIVQELESHLSVCDKLERNICNKISQEFSVLRQGILKKAFSGELVHQDENDEPVSVILERIKSKKELKKTSKKKSKQLQKVAV